MKALIALSLTLALAAAPTLAQTFKSGDITIEKAWARATPKGAAVGAGYLVIHNAGATPDTLVSGAANFANVEVHEMSMKNGVMQMRKLKDGLAVPPHGEVTLSPSGYHLMFAGLKTPLTKGEHIEATLTFAHAGPIAVEFDVLGIGARGPAAGGMKM
jgi:hypothetical protein